MVFIKQLLSLMAILSFFVSLVQSGSLMKAFEPEDVNEVEVATKDPNLFVSDGQSENLISRISKRFERQDDGEVMEVATKDPNLFVSDVKIESIISRIPQKFEPQEDSDVVEVTDNELQTKDPNLFVSDVQSERIPNGFEPENDSKFVEVPDNEMEAQDPNLFVSDAPSESLISILSKNDSEVVKVADTELATQDPNLFVNLAKSGRLISRISKGFEPENDSEVMEFADNEVQTTDPNFIVSDVQSESLISRISKGFDSKEDSKFVEIPDNEMATQDPNLFVSDAQSESQISRISKNDNEVVELADNELQTQDSNLFVNLAQSGSLISRISKGFEPEDDSEVVEISNNELQTKDPNLFDLSPFGRALYGIPDFNDTARLVDAYVPEESPVNPEELGSYVEGDILIPQSSVILKNGLVSSSTRWPNGVVPYEIGGQFRHNDLAMIANAFDQYHDRTCIRFVPRTHERDYITIMGGKSGCWSSIGRVGGRQEVNLQSPGCLSKPGTAIHELMHVLGFLHEQNRQERDSFVTIKYENIREVAYGNFKKVSPTIAFGVPYDYGSVMHYSSKAFSQNGRPTIVAKAREGKKLMGQRDGFSPMDVEKINRMYNCYQNAKPASPPVQLSNPPVPTIPSIFRAARPIANFFRNIIRG